MSGIQSGIADGVEMIDGALCTFMGDGVTLVSQPTWEGKVETAAISLNTYRRILQTWEIGRGPEWLDGAEVDNVFYQWMDATLVHVTDTETDEMVVVSLEDIKAVLGMLTH
jgi:hypothetical protein